MFPAIVFILINESREKKEEKYESIDWEQKKRNGKQLKITF